jgi:hypothetical protein
MVQILGRAKDICTVPSIVGGMVLFRRASNATRNTDLRKRA